jgi:alpha-glucosidase
MIGSYHALFAIGDGLLYRRKQGETSILVALNLGLEPECLQVEGCRGKILLSTYCDRADEFCEERIDLRPHEGVVVLERPRDVHDE